jgi:hypothetical protein
VVPTCHPRRARRLQAGLKPESDPAAARPPSLRFPDLFKAPPPQSRNTRNPRHRPVHSRCRRNPSAATAVVPLPSPPLCRRGVVSELHKQVRSSPVSLELEPAPCVARSRSPE